LFCFCDHVSETGGLKLGWRVDLDNHYIGC